MHPRFPWFSSFPVVSVQEFFTFSARERVRGSPRRREGGGDRISIENPRRGGGGLPTEGEGAEGPGGCLRGNWGGGG